MYIVQHMRFWYLSHWHAAEARMSLRIHSLLKAFAPCMHKMKKAQFKIQAPRL